ncbi:MAG TPA: glycosyltransferase [Sphingomicrobium sp.]|nr:glycosyltransferase [Sphingomicrobium sp.]
MTTDSGVSVRLAYLSNIYPAVSHSFIRREIESLERAGHQVSRFSLRPYHSEITDSADIREATRTESVLAQGWLRLVLAGVRALLLHPVRSCAAIATAYELSGKGLAQKARYTVYLLEAAWLVGRLRQLQVTHLHAHFGTNPAAIATIVRAWGGPPFSFTVHGPDEFDAPIELKLRSKIERASFVAAISSYCQSQLMRWVPEQQWHKIKLVRCGVDSMFLNAAPTVPPRTSVNFVAVARLSQQKGLPLLIDACAKLRDAGERFHLTIVGYGDLQREIEMKIRAQQLQDCVTLAGIKSSREICELLLAARAFILPSFAEGLPVVLMEALALARPVITTCIAGIPELVDDRCGWLIPAASVPDLVQAMTSALQTSPEDLLSKGLVGRERVLRLHDADRNASALYDAIAQSVSERMGTAGEAKMQGDAR